MKIVEHRIKKGKTITTCLCIGITKEQGLRIVNKLNNKYSYICDDCALWFELIEDSYQINIFIY